MLSKDISSEFSRYRVGLPRPPGESSCLDSGDAYWSLRRASHARRVLDVLTSVPSTIRVVVSILLLRIRTCWDDATSPTDDLTLDAPTVRDTDLNIAGLAVARRGSHCTNRRIHLLSSSSCVRRLFVSTACFIALTAHSKGIDVAEWNEEVKLSDGRMVTVWRRARAHSAGFPNARRGSNIDFEIRYEPLGVRWKDEVSHSHVREPVSFDIIDGVPILVLYVGDREGCRNRPPNDYSAQFLKWFDNQWIDVPQAQFPVERALMNLYTRYWGRTTKDDARGLITWQLKAERNGFYADRPDTVKSYFTRGARTCESNLKN